jgi:hypothetical protein
MGFSFVWRKVMDDVTARLNELIKEIKTRKETVAFRNKKKEEVSTKTKKVTK